MAVAGQHFPEERRHDGPLLRVLLDGLRDELELDEVPERGIEIPGTEMGPRSPL